MKNLSRLLVTLTFIGLGMPAFAGHASHPLHASATAPQFAPIVNTGYEFAGTVPGPVPSCNPFTQVCPPIRTKIVAEPALLAFASSPK